MVFCLVPVALCVCVCVQGRNVLNFLRFAVAETAAVANYVRYVCSQEELDYAREPHTLYAQRCDCVTQLIVGQELGSL